ncbi:50S ribosomal protein L29 [Desulfuromonas sp. CSMB_57]|jgi:large subunit ribosomal protein L29|uniref:50S ribosomal protein L29 n=1 Tax=Desulfuromonas sp. CSMB_57 TaxID=2807629 RepID=UPI001CD1C108|nr:50S ribosomal protein L29 [Desulfuromonas sp. CSMB_57]
MKANELRELSVDDLEKKVQDLNRELFNLKFQMAAGQLESSARLPKTRRDIARAMTILREKRG